MRSRRNFPRISGDILTFERVNVAMSQRELQSNDPSVFTIMEKQEEYREAHLGSGP